MLPIPYFYDPYLVYKIWRVPYDERHIEAREWAVEHNIEAADTDQSRTLLLLIDVQNTFCIPEFELYVSGAEEDNQRLCSFIYRNIPNITNIVCTMDTHTSMQIFHQNFWINDAGEHPTPLVTLITPENIESGEWYVNKDIVDNMSFFAYPLHVPKFKEYQWLVEYSKWYVKKVTEDGKFPLTIWPYHAMLGGIGHSIVSSVEEACFFHGETRRTQVQYELKGQNPITENYSAINPEVLRDQHNRDIALKNIKLLNQIYEYDRIIIAGQAKSHCVNWTVRDILSEFKDDRAICEKIYLVQDLTSPVIVPEIVDYTEMANEAFASFEQQGMKLIHSADSLI